MRHASSQTWSCKWAPPALEGCGCFLIQIMPPFKWKDAAFNDMIDFGNIWHLNEAETWRVDLCWEKIIRQISGLSVLLADWGASLFLGFLTFSPSGDERPLWGAGDEQPMVTSVLSAAHGISSFYPITTSNQPVLVFHSFLESQTKPSLFIMMAEKKWYFSCFMSVLFQSDPCFEPFQNPVDWFF